MGLWQRIFGNKEEKQLAKQRRDEADINRLIEEKRAQEYQREIEEHAEWVATTAFPMFQWRLEEISTNEHPKSLVVLLGRHFDDVLNRALDDAPDCVREQVTRSEVYNTASRKMESMLLDDLMKWGKPAKPDAIWSAKAELLRLRGHIR